MKNINGTVLCYNMKDENGIVVDAIGNEYYFDISTVLDKHISLKSGIFVQGNITNNVLTVIKEVK